MEVQDKEKRLLRRTRASSKEQWLALQQTKLAPLSFGQPALVIGGADCVWDDLKQAQELVDASGVDWTIIAANDIGIHLQHIDHWCSLHPENFPQWEHLRAEKFGEKNYRTWTNFGKKWLAESFPQRWGPWEGGSTGMLGVAVARDLGACGVVLCGIPITQTPHFQESVVHLGSKFGWEAAERIWKVWIRSNTVGKLKVVRSFSGRTRELCGAPSIEWIKERITVWKNADEHERLNY